MFQDGLNLHTFAKAVLVDQVKKIIDPFVVQEGEKFQIDLENKKNVEESLVFIIKIGVICSSKSPIHRMDINDVLTTLHGI